MLESCSSDMPEDCSGDSSTAQKATYSATTKGKSNEKKLLISMMSLFLLNSQIRPLFDSPVK